MNSSQKSYVIKLLVSTGMVLCIVIAAFFSGYYYHAKLSINECNEFINENYVQQINEFNDGQDDEQYKFGIFLPDDGEINATE